MKASVDSAKRATSSAQRKEWCSQTRARTLERTALNSPSNAMTTSPCASPSIVRSAAEFSFIHVLLVFDAMEDYRKLFDLAGKKALVFGAASGIGKASAEALASMGAEVHCADIDEAKAQATAAGIREAGGKAGASRADAS